MKYFRYLQLCHTLPEVLRITGPRVVLASWPDLESGFARDLFALWCADSRNSIILTSRSGVGTLGRKLYDNPGMKSVTLELKQRVKLEGFELEEYRRKEREKIVMGGGGVGGIKEDRTADASSESEDEEILKPNHNAHHQSGGRVRHDIVVRSEENRNSSVPNFFKSSKKNPTLFPYFEEKLKFDDYGEIIRPEDYVIAETEDFDAAAVKIKTEWNEEMQVLNFEPFL